jgi:hypothetical protein
METKYKLDEVTVDNYDVPKGEEGLFHAVIEVKEFNSKTGERVSVPRVQKFGVNAFETAFPNLKRLGYDVRVVYDPTAWIEKQTKEAEERERQSAQSAAEAQQAAIEEALEKQCKEFEEKQQAAIDEAVAKALAAVNATQPNNEGAAPKNGAK